jgi:transcriptional regulator with XRE-family HTH domain
MSISVDGIDSAISARVHRERAERHWTLNDLAERAGVSKA